MRPVLIWDLPRRHFRLVRESNIMPSLVVLYEILLPRARRSLIPGLLPDRLLRLGNEGIGPVLMLDWMDGGKMIAK